jgi:ATP-dependent DNA helicase RecG
MNLEFALKSVIRTTPAHFKKMVELGIFSVREALEFFPRTIESTEISSNFSQIQLGVKNTISGSLCDFRKEKTARGKALGKATLILDDGAEIEVIWFQIPYLLRNLRDESFVFLVGKINRNYGKIQISNPEIYLQKGVHVGGIRPIYPESPPLTSKWWREKMSGLLIFAKEFPEILPSEILQTQNLMSKADAIAKIHFPENAEEWQKARLRLGFEEIFEIQMRVIRGKMFREQIAENNFQVPLDVEGVKFDLEKLPFVLTTAQKKVLFQILSDFEKARPAYRLIQGDVGSGKTIVALLAANRIHFAGFQTAILAPTEILATQHFASALKFFNLETTRIELLTGSTTAKRKKEIKNDLKAGKINVLIGTHAILTEDTIFKNLGFAVIDEQHRFGVAQRAILSESGAHTIAMSATPIPRTLALTIYGDQDLSVIDELPPGRQKIITRVIADEKTRTLMTRFIDDQISKKRQIFWVCPLIDESDKIEAKNVLTEFEHIKNDFFPNRRVEFLHGKMKSKEKEAVMSRFKNEEFDILVSTSVIEVGVDIPSATVMVIENSERFGLAQLHQFRGRIGRNDFQSYCFCMTGKKDDKQKARLQAMERSNDGFYLAEIDLKLRGAGEIYGLKQSGIPDLKCADLTDVKTMESARNWAIKILEEDLYLKKYPELLKQIESTEVYF